ncbi:hypothetical protein J2S49_001510 [Arcanobacterium wilhelmae]|uniref:Uncharacterized protein n=1 Tax=Arcanobacterium wilhelmae TaxID=1803177 RepID=A0ABT9NCJ2_9ACTO|nr:hypothetical protein [Arcanobacterium wilhelmae]MDP9801434.1 hypothetical protein [Arcanobacterium wilhelmae]WFN90769.1 hypothetical protein P8A24_02625 [Arcanobacterium wilhelmae]
MRISQTWLGPTSIKSETFILKSNTVLNPQEFANDHKRYLASIDAEPDEAAHWWHWQKDKVSEPGVGWVSLKLNDTQLMPLEAWTNVGGFWINLLGAIDNYLKTGAGFGGFSDEPDEFSIIKKGEIALFTLRSSQHVVDPQSFVSSLLDGASNFYHWADTHIGTYPPSAIENIDRMLNSLRSS